MTRLVAEPRSRPYVAFVIPVCRDPRLSSAIERLRMFAASHDIEAEILSVGDMRGVVSTVGDRHIHVCPAKKGTCVRTGVRASLASSTVVIDADVPVSDSDLATIIQALGKADVVIGSRVDTSHSTHRRPFARRAASHGFRILCQRLFGLNGLDTQCGVKAFRTSIGKELLAKQRTAGLAYDVELVLRARTHGARIMAVPVRWTHTFSTVNVWRDAPFMLAALLCLAYYRLTTGDLHPVDNPQLERAPA